jgi:hypothetical protein
MHFEGWVLVVCDCGCGYKMRKVIDIRDGRMTSGYIYSWHRRRNPWIPILHRYIGSPSAFVSASMNRVEELFQCFLIIVTSISRRD